MKLKKNSRKAAQAQAESRLYRIVDEAGKEVDSFILSADHPRVTLRMQLVERCPVMTPEKQLEADVYSGFDEAFSMLEELEKIAPAKALAILADLFPE